MSLTNDWCREAQEESFAPCGQTGSLGEILRVTKSSMFSRGCKSAFAEWNPTLPIPMDWLRNLADVETGAVLFFHLFHGTNSAAEIGDLG